MPQVREIRIALLGALVFIVAGSVQGCASDSIAGPQEAQLEAQTSEGDSCVQVNGVWICK
jgi:hypothetical protein